MIVVVARRQLADVKVTEPPLLVVEVRSPRTALIDLNTKKSAYEQFGVGSYWIFVPSVDQPELIAFELRDGRFDEAAHVTGKETFRTQRPFPFALSPADLVAALLPD